MKLVRFIIRRLILLLPVMVGVLVLTFFIARILPGDPVFLLVGQQFDEQTLARIREEMGLDKPVLAQFVDYVSRIFRGDLGKAFHTGHTVMLDVQARFPATLELVTLGLLLCIFVAIPLGVIAAVKRDGFLDHVARVTSLAGLSLPEFWLSLILIFLLYYRLGWAPPPMGRAPIGFSVPHVTGMYLVDSLLAGDFESFRGALSYIALPVVTLALVNLAPVMRLTRSAMIEVLDSDHVRASRAFGIKEATVRFRFALKNALIPPITMLGLTYGRLLGGTVITETIFAWPGLGSWAVNAAAAHDYAPLQAFALLAAFTRVLISLITDLVYFAIDPRIKN